MKIDYNNITPEEYYLDFSTVQVTDKILLALGFVKSDDILDYENIFRYDSLWVSNYDTYVNVGVDWIEEDAIRCYEIFYLSDLIDFYRVICNKNFDLSKLEKINLYPITEDKKLNNLISLLTEAYYELNPSTLSGESEKLSHKIAKYLKKINKL